MKMETKSLTATETKAEPEGRIVARFASLGQVDKDGDIVAHGSIGRQDVQVSAYDHAVWNGSLPIGKGTIREDGDSAIADLTLFMATDAGREHYEVIKGLGELGQWSWGFTIAGKADPSDAERKAGARRVITDTKVYEVSPVFRAAGVGTETLAMKNADDKDGLRCRECSGYLGEAAVPLVFIGLKKQSSEVKLKGPRDLRHCGRCRNMNVFLPAKALGLS